jgi:uncharacterized protein (UPF0332 family)
MGCSKEATERAAISRAYYSAFCHARNYAYNKHGFTPTRKAKDHELLISHFEIIEQVDSAFEGVADNLDELRIWRNNCDYDDEVAVITDLNSLVEGALDDAKEIIDILK